MASQNNQQQHPDSEVQEALDNLTKLLQEPSDNIWAFILKEDGGFTYRMASGDKPANDEETDEQFLSGFPTERPREEADKEIASALLQLGDRICSWERATGRQSIFIYRQMDGTVHRLDCGKPGIPDDIEDGMLLQRFAA